MRNIIRFLDLVLSPALFLALVVSRVYRRLGTGRTPTARRLYNRLGVYPIIDQYYDPPAFLDDHVARQLATPRDLPGIDLRPQAQQELLARLTYQEELLAIPYHDPGGQKPFYRNGYFETGDAEILYSLIRLQKPRRLIEVGSGFSTLFARHAIEANLQEDPTYCCEHVCIEPYRAPWLQNSGATVVRSRLEDCDPALFAELEAGDMLFIDSTHMIRPRGDVVRLHLEIIPALSQGCLVHVHDIFTPRDYPARWMQTERRLWNEQYLVEALLSHSSRLEVLLALNFLNHQHPEALRSACPVLDRDPGEKEPGSLWLRVAGA